MAKENKTKYIWIGIAVVVIAIIGYLIFVNPSKQSVYICSDGKQVNNSNECLPQNSNVSQIEDSEDTNEKTWHKVFEVNVTSGSKTTDTFKIKGEKFRVYFSGLVSSPYMDYVLADIYVYKPGENAYTEKSSAGGCNKFSETSSLCDNVQEFYVYENGEFYLKINQANIDYWFVFVYDYY